VIIFAQFLPTFFKGLKTLKNFGGKNWQKIANWPKKVGNWPNIFEKWPGAKWLVELVCGVFAHLPTFFSYYTRKKIFNI